MACGSEVSDHFSAWMALGAAGIALVASLAGVVVTSIFENRRDVERRAHADRVEYTKRQHEAAVRFHDERLSAYVEYMSTVSSLFAIASVWLSNGASGRFLDFAGAHDVLGPYIKAMQLVSMLAMPELNLKMVGVHSHVNQLVSSQTAEAISQAVDGSISARADFETAAKKELGID